jgi:hypothetical protein
VGALTKGAIPPREEEGNYEIEEFQITESMAALVSNHDSQIDKNIMFSGCIFLSRLLSVSSPCGE